VLLFTLAISLLTGILFGLAPVLQGSGPRPNSALKKGNQHSAESLVKSRLQNLPAVTEITLAFVLLVGAGLLMRSFIKNPGFETRHLTGTWNYRNRDTQPGHKRSRSKPRALEKLQQVPGVMSTGSVFGLPLGDMLMRGDIEIENQPTPARAQKKVRQKLSSVATISRSWEFLCCPGRLA
jgi:putative ABC transport system permease protein